MLPGNGSWQLKLPPTSIPKPFRNRNGSMSNGRCEESNRSESPPGKRISDKIRAAFVRWKLLMNSNSRQPVSEMLMVHCTSIRLKNSEQKPPAGVENSSPALELCNLSADCHKENSAQKRRHRKRGWACNFQHFNYGCCHNNHNGFGSTPSPASDWRNFHARAAAKKINKKKPDTEAERCACVRKGVRVSSLENMATHVRYYLICIMNEDTAHWPRERIREFSLNSN